MSINSEFEQAYAHQMRGDLARAAQGYRGLVLSMPYTANHNLGVVYLHMGRTKEAEAALRAALEAQPDGAEPAFVLAAMLLAEGRFEEAWPLYERRRAVPGITPAPPADAGPEWTGQDLAGKRLLVVGEQGLGDAIMLARFLPVLKAMGAEVVYAGLPAVRHERGVDPAPATPARCAICFIVVASTPCSPCSSNVAWTMRRRVSSAASPRLACR